jgi:hypothetical protein
MRTKNRCLAIAVLVALSTSAAPAFAAVGADEAKQLGTTLLPWGAEKGGNKEGTIPDWTGQVNIPTNYDPTKPGVRPDPFSNEKPLFSINAQNMDRYADKLSDGVRAMMMKYPSFRVDVYPSHRTAAYPKYVIDNTLKNVTSCKAINNGLKLEGCYGGLPFPIPKTGNEAMWNHTARYTAYSWFGIQRGFYVDSSGKPVLQGVNNTYEELPFYDPKRTGPATAETIYWRLRADISEPARKAGEKLVFLDALDSVNIGRRVWQYLPGQRRVKLAPDLAYDTPAPQSGGSQTMDDAQLFLGALDRFDWKLVGKKEMFIPYNNFKIADAAACPDKVKFAKNHMNPDCIRWELHRVWAVQGMVKANFRHIYKTRTFYFDEDVPGAGIGDNYDASGKIYRVTLGTYYPLYEAQGLMTDQSTTHDLLTSVYATSGDVGETGGWYVVPSKPVAFYTGEALAGEGVR